MFPAPAKARFYFGTTMGRRRLVARALRFFLPLTRLLAFLWRRGALRRVRFIAVTGSLGKSMTTSALFNALNVRRHRFSDLNSQLLFPSSILNIRPWQRHAVIEIGIERPGHMERRLRRIRPRIVVVTSIATEHITSFGSIENIAREKGLAVQALPPDGLAVLNGDDHRVAAMAETAPCPVVTFGLGAGNDARAENVGMDWPAGMRFDLVWRGERRAARIPIFGLPGVYAALAAAAAALSEQEPLDTVVERLALIPRRRGRLFPMALPNDAHVLEDDYKGPFESYYQALDTLAAIPAKRRIVVFGQFTERPREKPRELMRELGGRVGAMADIFIFFGSRKASQAFRSGARKAGMKDDAIHYVRKDMAECISLLRGLIQPGDVVLLKGRHELRLNRIGLALSGRPVRCDLSMCNTHLVHCSRCTMLERGWRDTDWPYGRARAKADKIASPSASVS